MASFDWGKYQPVTAQASEAQRTLSPAGVPATPGSENSPGFDWNKYQSIGASNSNMVPAPTPSALQTAYQQGLKSLAIAGAKIPANVLTGVARGTYDLLGLMPGFKNVVPEPQSINTMLGLQENGMDRFIQGIGSAIPTAVGAEVALPARLLTTAAKGVPELLKNTPKLAAFAESYLPGALQTAKMGGEGALYNTSIGEDPLTGALIGAGMPLAIGGAIKGADSLIVKPIKKALVGSAAPNILKKEFSMIDAPATVMDNTEGLLRTKHDEQLDLYKAMDDSTYKSAQTLDGIEKFDNATYKKSLRDIKKGLNNSVRDAADIKDINNLLKTAPRSLQEAIDMRKYINSELPYSPATAKAKKALIDAVDENIAKFKSPEAEKFSQEWQATNKQYSEKVAPFYSLPNQKGKLVPNNELRKSLRDEYANSEGNLMKFYIPGKARIDTLGAKHLENILGDSMAARDVSKAAYFKDAFDVEGVPKMNFLSKYEGLSPKRKDMMFTSDQIQLLDTLSLLRKDKKGILGNLKTKGAGAVAGGLTGELLASILGIPHGYGATTGAGVGALVADKGLQAASEAIPTNKFLRMAKEVEKKK